VKYLFRLIVFVAAIAFIFIACGDGSGGGGGGGVGPGNLVDPTFPPSNITSYTVTFNNNGGSGTIPTQTVAVGSRVTLPNGSGLSKSGYTFGGWNTNSSGTGITYSAGFSYTPTGNIELFAKWYAVGTTIYTVIFDANGGTGTAPTAQTEAAGYTITLPNGNGLSKIGSTFGGWNTNSSGTGTNYSAGSSYTVNANTTLYAKWNINQYTISFSADGGTPTPVQQTLNHGDKVSEPPTMTKTGYTFGGWYREAVFINTWNFATDTVTTTTTLYAKWNINQYTVNFSADGGTPAPAQQNINYGGKVTQPSAMTKTGYSFGGWYREAAFTNTWNFASDTVTQAITLYAKWLKNEASITLDVKQITEGAPIIDAITISRTGSNSIPDTFSVTVSNPSDYTSITWEIAGAGVIYAGPPVTGSGATFTLNAADSRYNSLGGHALILTVVKGGMQYQKTIPFTIVQ